METKKPGDIITEISDELQAKKIVPGLSLGSIAPDFTISSSENEMVSLSDLYDSDTQFIVLNFYRGDWCSFCRKELTDLQDHLNDFNKYKAKIFAISPQTTTEAAKLKAKLELEFDLLSDPNQNVIKDYRLHYTVHEEIQKIYTNRFHLNLPEHTANETWELPVPATYVLNKNREVIQAFVEMNYRLRLSADTILGVISDYSERY